MGGNATNRPLGQLLLDKGLVTDDQLSAVLKEQQLTGKPLGKLLVAMGFLTEAVLRDALAERLGAVAVDLAQALIDPAAIALVDEGNARRLQVMPMAWDEARRVLVVASANPGDLVMQDRLRALLPGEAFVEALLATESQIMASIDQHYGHTLPVEGLLAELENASPTGSLLQEDHAQPIVRLVDALIQEAVKQRASDIHFEPEAGFLRIRYRTDGLLRQVRVLHKAYWPAMVVRIKVISGMNIAENRAPQDGRVSFTISGRPIDCRVSTQPTLHGENIVLRILDRQKGIVPLAELGLGAAHLERLAQIMARPEGLVLVTGPTGAGKTTTLYSILHHLDDEGLNIMTLEDPVEYPMGRVRQTSVAESVKLDFANGIRAMMRQDPDVILVGEIRDGETATMAFRAAMTGHQVYATLHSNSALGAIPRLLDIGISAEIMAGNINGIIAQRLLRRLCLHCREGYEPGPEERVVLGVPPEEGLTLYRPVGCEHCDGRGYQGRLAIMELLVFDDGLDALLAAKAPAHLLAKEAMARGYSPLAEDGCRRVLGGETSLPELRRVVALGRG